MKKYVEWVDARAQKIMTDGLAFYTTHPQDARRWDVVLTVINRPPYFMKDFVPKPGVTQSVNDIVPDEAAKQAWTARTEELKRALLAASDSQPDQREMIEFQDFAATSRGLRAKLKSGEEKDARTLWQGLLARFDAHIARYAGNARLGPEAENFLSAWREVVPGSMEEGCRHFLAAPDAGVKKFATEKLASLAQIEKPLDLAFTAVDGRSVDLMKLRGKVVLVDFWATWCGPCKAELPNIIAAYKKYHDQGFEVVGITLENGNLAGNDTPAQREAKLTKARKALTDFTAQNNMPWPQHFDGQYWKNEFATKFGIGAIPAMFLVDQAGRIVSTNARGEKLEQEIKRLLKL
jgi:thiol-disulfide isomerase/thioredoxin